MTNTPLAAAFLVAAFLVAGTAAAQERPAISITPADSALWDIAGHVGWFRNNTSDVIGVGDDWHSVFAAGVTAGRYFTPHIKGEIHATMTGEARMYRFEQLAVGAAPPVVRALEYDVQTATMGTGVFYQLFENQWFHPFVGAGAEVVRERARVELQQRFGTVLPGREPSPLTLPPRRVSHTARPFAATGFKWYVGERAFFRTSLHVSFSNHGTTDVTWAAGIGVDL
jgi:opacity protein-like surface antigen